MTAKEKARELVKKFMPHAHYYTHDLAPKYQMDGEQKENAEYCAEIAVSEIIESIKKIHNGMTWSERKQVIDRNVGLRYWEDVKKEIEKL